MKVRILGWEIILNEVPSCLHMLIERYSIYASVLFLLYMSLTKNGPAKSMPTFVNVDSSETRNLGNGGILGV